MGNKVTNSALTGTNNTLLIQILHHHVKTAFAYNNDYDLVTRECEGVFQDFEHINGKRLFEAIRADDPEKTQEAISYAKMEFSKPVVRNSNNAEFDDMYVTFVILFFHIVLTIKVSLSLLYGCVLNC